MPNKMLKYFLRFFLFSVLTIISVTNCSTIAGSYYKKDSGISTAPTTKGTKGTKSEEARVREDIIAYAKKYEGAKYKAAGRTPRGFDCSGFTGYVMKKFDIPLAASSADQAKDGQKIAVKDAAPGDLIFFRRSAAGPIFHVSLVVSNDKSGLRVIHSTSRGVVIDNISQSSYWNPKIYSARRVVGK